MRATKNVEQETQRFKDFSTKVLAPVLAAMSLADTKYAEPISITSRQVQDTHGKAAADCFVILFKRLNRGGYSETTGKAFYSTWVPNPEAVSTYLAWISSNPAELTCRSLLHALKSADLEALQWSRDVKGWVSSELVKAAAAAKSQVVEVEDTTNYAFLKTVIDSNTTNGATV